MENAEVIRIYAVEELVHFKQGSRWMTYEVFYRRDTAWRCARELIARSGQWTRPMTRKDVRTRRMIARFE